MDDLEHGAQPHCPDCGTVMVTANRGFFCRGCQRFDPMPPVERPTGGDDLPGIHWG